MEGKKMNKMAMCYVEPAILIHSHGGKKMKRSAGMDSIVTEQRPWSELPMEILLLIAQYIDQKEDLVRTFTVCRSWNSVTPFIHRHKKGTDPLLLSFPGIEGVGELYDHLSQKTYSISVPELNETACGCSTDGWLLLDSFDMFISVCGARVPQLFFFNPFTTDRIDFPVPYQLINQDSFYSSFYMGLIFNTYAFSSPSDPKWTLFALKSFSQYEVMICTYHSGDRDWATTIYPVEDKDHRFIQTRTNVVLHKGVFYCLGKFGKLGAFDSINHAWTVTSPKVGKRFTDLVKKYFVESNGELFVVDDHRMRVNVFWLDKTKMEWLRVKSLGGRTLYVGSVGSVMVTPSNPSMKNRVYFPERVQKGNQDICVSYSLETGKYEPMIELFGCRKNEREFTNPEINAWIQPRGFVASYLSKEDETVSLMLESEESQPLSQSP